MFGCRECSDLFNAMDAGDCKVLQNIDHYPPDQRHYHHGAAVHTGPSYPECGQIVPALLSSAQYSATRHYQADITYIYTTQE